MSAKIFNIICIFSLNIIINYEKTWSIIVLFLIINRLNILLKSYIINKGDKYGKKKKNVKLKKN